MLAVRLHAREVAVEGPAAEPDLAVDEDVGRDVLTVALEPEPRAPRLRGPHLEHPQPALLADIAVEEDLKGMSVRQPVGIVPPELPIHERKSRVDGVVGLVPAL